jgi:hypothetical protein
MHVHGSIIDSVCRHLICFLMLVYGIVTLFQGQFYADFHWRDSLLGKLDARQLTWAFYGHSPWFERLLGAAEIGLGLLVLFPRTSTLGTVLFVPFAIHLVALNLLYEINAFATAIPLLIAGVYLPVSRWSEIRPLWNRPAVGTASAGRSRWGVSFAVALAACGLAAAIVYNNKSRWQQVPQLRGAWRVVEPDQAQIERIYFEKGTQCVVRDSGGVLKRGVEAGTIALTEFPLAAKLPNSAAYKLVNAESLVMETPQGTWRLERISWPLIGDPP